METSAEREKISFKPGHRGRAVFLIVTYIFLILLMAVMVIPLLKVFVDSVDPTAYGIRLWPKVVDFMAYKMILSNQTLYRPFLVSVFTTVLGTFVGLLLTTMGAYVLIQKNMPGHKFCSNFILFTMLFSGGMIPTYLNIRNLHLMNNLIAVIIPCGLSAYNMILMKSFFATIPESLYEAAELDGCTPMDTFFRVVLPLSKPALATIGLFIAVGFWNEYMHFILYITNPDWKNFQVKIRDLILNDGISGNAATLSMSQEMLKSAVVIVVVFPFLIIYPFVQKYFTKGITLGAVKG
ncbi:MAG: carbohydrate ABC transporter permease [Hungatella sp.]|nr:carbohydrate ABC transporter permease [Hungatella sp.]MCI9359565.1 carbohydrate ABC transporter permease [Hungatella sp.]